MYMYLYMYVYIYIYIVYVYTYIYICIKELKHLVLGVADHKGCHNGKALQVILMAPLQRHALTPNLLFPVLPMSVKNAFSFSCVKRIHVNAFVCMNVCLCLCCFFVSV